MNGVLDASNAGFCTRPSPETMHQGAVPTTDTGLVVLDGASVRRGSTEPEETLVVCMFLKRLFANGRTFRPSG
jgi:hypothetical protein